MSARSKLRNESGVFLLVLAGIVILLNLLSVRFFGRLDLTRDGVFSLSQASINLVQGLEDKLLVKAYFTENLPGRFGSLERHVRDLLEEYRQHSGGKLQVEFIDPTGDEEAEEVAKNLGIRKMPNPDIEKDQATIKEGYRGIAFSYGQHNEVIAAVDSPVGLEYQVTMTLKKVIGHKDDVGFLVGHGEPQVDPPNESDRPLLPEERKARGAYRNIRNNLEIYNYKQVDLKGGESEIPREIDSLVIVGPTEKISDKELYRLDQFLLQGNSLAFFLAGVNVAVEPAEMPMLPPTYKTAVSEPGLRKFLEHHGATIGRDLVYDQQAANYVAKCPPLPLPLPRPYPVWPIVTAFDDDHPVTFRLGSLTTPYVSPVRVTKAAAADKERDAREIAFSSGNSWVEAGDAAVVDPCGIVESQELESGIPLAAAISGTFTSFFEGQELPVDDGAKSKDGLSKPDAGKFLARSAEPGRLIVVGSAALPLDESLMYLARSDKRQAQNNFSFVQNVLDWMTNEDDLISVRMKTVSDPPLEKGSEQSKGLAKWGNIIGVPLAFVLFGVVRWRIRVGRRSRRSAKAAS